MKAVFFEKYGGLEVLKYGEFPTPEPQKGEALVRVRACGLNHLDIWLRNEASKVSLPHIVGSDVSDCDDNSMIVSRKIDTFMKEELGKKKNG